MLKIELEDNTLKIHGNPEVSKYESNRTIESLGYFYVSMELKEGAQMKLYEQLQARLMQKGLLTRQPVLLTDPRAEEQTTVQVPFTNGEGHLLVTGVAETFIRNPLALGDDALGENPEPVAITQADGVGSCPNPDVCGCGLQPDPFTAEPHHNS